MEAELEGETILITAEVAQQIGDNRVRAICLKPTDGLRRGAIVRNLAKSAGPYRAKPSAMFRVADEDESLI